MHSPVRVERASGDIGVWAEDECRWHWKRSECGMDGIWFIPSLLRERFEQDGKVGEFGVSAGFKCPGVLGLS